VIHVRALRGATTLDANTVDQMVERVPEMVQDLLDRNQISTDDVVSAIFMSTPDLTCMHPATAVRKAMDFAEVPMAGAQELDVPGSVDLCVRVMLHVETTKARSEMVHVYLHGAAVLRPDLAPGQS
jgi:chorismate mutase